jgi:hypothetical protein
MMGMKTYPSCCSELVASLNYDFRQMRLNVACFELRNLPLG